MRSSWMRWMRSSSAISGAVEAVLDFEVLVARGGVVTVLDFEGHVARGGVVAVVGRPSKRFEGHVARGGVVAVVGRPSKRFEGYVARGGVEVVEVLLQQGKFTTMLVFDHLAREHYFRSEALFFEFISKKCYRKRVRTVLMVVFDSLSLPGRDPSLPVWLQLLPLPSLRMVGCRHPS